ncbi:MAG: sigma-54 dependent transcriptional regulator [Spirochaetaceae bacterium]|jgi:two-component system nitrogen regulation response regulator NtrX|nr:sigma-54 dependent transcriptional regulator [Spirochaetaceae bacterium]
MTAILVIDDESGIRRTLAEILEDERYKVHTAEDAVAGLAVLNREPIDLVLLDILLPKLGGIEALEKIREMYPSLEVVVMSGHGSVDMAVRATKLGAFDFLEKPLSLEKVLTVCRNALTLRRLREENRDLKKSISLKYTDELIGNSEEIKQVKAMIEQAAASDARILITGENGTGKELVARAVHRGSSRADKAFVEVNCAAIPDSLIETELFGHQKGAFTDAVATRKGRFELAAGGTLFLDEIGDMSLSAQAKVLRAIQEQKIERVGGEQTLDVDVRIVAATNKNLLEECGAGRFRQDLYFRLNVILIYMPPLRERSGDIPILLEHFLREIGGPGYSQNKIRFDDKALGILKAYDWPGNVRELRNVAERILVLYPEGAITEEALMDLLQKSPVALGNQPKDSAETGFADILDLQYAEAKDAFEKRYLEYQLAKHEGVITHTAEAIGIYPSNLHTKVKKHKIRTDQQK